MSTKLPGAEKVWAIGSFPSWISIPEVCFESCLQEQNPVFPACPELCTLICPRHSDPPWIHSYHPWTPLHSHGLGLPVPPNSHVAYRRKTQSLLRGTLWPSSISSCSVFSPHLSRGNKKLHRHYKKFPATSPSAKYIHFHGSSHEALGSIHNFLSG